MLGPIDYIVVEFHGNNFKGEALQELKIAMKNKIINVLDIALIAKNTTGNVTAIELNNLDNNLTQFINTTKSSGSGLITDEDIEEVGNLLSNNCAAGLLIIEQLWAKGFKKAIIDAGGKLVSEGRIHPDASKQLNQNEEE